MFGRVRRLEWLCAEVAKLYDRVREQEAITDAMQRRLDAVEKERIELLCWKAEAESQLKELREAVEPLIKEAEEERLLQRQWENLMAYTGRVQKRDEG